MFFDSYNANSNWQREEPNLAPVHNQCAFRRTLAVLRFRYTGRYMPVNIFLSGPSKKA